MPLQVPGPDGPVLDLDRAPAVLEAVGVPPALVQATLATSRFELVDEVREWYAGTLNGDDVGYLAVLLGPASNYTAAALVRNAVKRGLTVSWYTWHDFASRYTDSIERSRLLVRGSIEETFEAAQETAEAQDEDVNLRQVYELLVITDFDINNVRDFAVPEVCSMFRNRSDFQLVTVITVTTADSGPLEQRANQWGAKGALIRMFESEAAVFDGRQ
jgi:hypothetical protein